MKAPFLVNNMLPDKMVTEFVKEHSVSDAVELGCGVGRNAVDGIRSIVKFFES